MGFGVLANGDIAISEYFNGNYYLLDSSGNLKEKLEGETQAPARRSPRTERRLLWLPRARRAFS